MPIPARALGVGAGPAAAPGARAVPPDAAASRADLSTVSFGAFVNNLHNHVALASILPGKEVDHLCFCIREIMRWGKWAGVDMPSIIQMKHDYNTTRDYRHGGKRL